MVPLELTAVASATEAAIPKKMLGSGTITLTVFDKEMNHILVIIKCLKVYVLLIKGVTKTIKNEAKRKRRISLHVAGHISRQFISKYVSRKRCIKSWTGNK